MIRKEFQKKIHRCPACKAAPDMTMIKEIKDIPYSVVLDDDSVSLMVRCAVCKAHTKKCKTSDEAFAEWNAGNIVEGTVKIKELPVGLPRAAGE